MRLSHRPGPREASDGLVSCPGPRSRGLGGNFCQVMVGWRCISGGEVYGICNSFILPLHHEEAIGDWFQLLGVSAELGTRQGAGAVVCGQQEVGRRG